MHHVNVGPPPARLAVFARRHTASWIAYYVGKSRTAPTDADWRRFEPDVRAVFHGLCAYCERACKGEIDHIRPKSKFPRLVYDWINWAYACHDCNHFKSDAWPQIGLLNPNDPRPAEYPERFLEFNLIVGDQAPRRGLRGRALERAKATIRALDLNGYALLKARAQLLALLRGMAELAGGSATGRKRLQRLLRDRCSPDGELASLVRAFVEDQAAAKLRAG